MKKSTFWSMIAAACLLLVGAFVYWRFGGPILREITLNYPNAEQYTAGPATLPQAIESLDIHWLDGSVTIGYHPESTVILEEEAREEIPAEAALRWWLDGATLRIQYAKAGVLQTAGLKKRLTVTLPEGIVLKTASLETTSGNLHVPALMADQAYWATTSGDASITVAAPVLRGATTSGSHTVVQKGYTDTAKLTATSGTIRLTGETIRDLDAGVTSGNSQVQLTGDADRVKLVSTAGSIGLSAASVRQLDAGSTSGNVQALLSGDADTVKLVATSGALLLEARNLGAVSAGSNSGGVTVKAEAADTVEVGCNSGNANIQLNAFHRLEAGATSGSVTAALPIIPGYTARIISASGSVTLPRSLVREGDGYTCGDGSGRVSIHTTSGAIRLQ